MLIIFLDTETTGLNPEKHRAIEIAFKIVDTQNNKVLSSYSTLISQPVEIWAEADPQSLQFNQLSYETNLKGKSEKVVASDIMNDFHRADLRDKSGVFLCQNPSFDRVFFNQIISVEMQENLHWPYHWLDLASTFLAYRILKDREALRKLREENLSKDQIAKYLNLSSEEKPHRAMRGVDHLMRCFEALLGLNWK